jgi:hypothetical protein
MEIKNYRKKGVQPMYPWEMSVQMDVISISPADQLAGSPKYGDMIAFNPRDWSDSWLVSQDYFEKHYEEDSQKEIL